MVGVRARRVLHTARQPALRAASLSDNAVARDVYLFARRIILFDRDAVCLLASAGGVMGGDGRACHTPTPKFASPDRRIGASKIL
jgi:hypothetical protein